MPSLISARTGIFFRFAKRQGNITELVTHILGVEEAQAGVVRDSALNLSETKQA